MPAKKRAVKGKKKGTRRRTKKHTFTADEIANALGHIVEWINVLRRLLRSMPNSCESTTALNLDHIIDVVVNTGEKIGCPPAR